MTNQKYYWIIQLKSGKPLATATGRLYIYEGKKSAEWQKESLEQTIPESLKDLGGGIKIKKIKIDL